MLNKVIKMSLLSVLILVITGCNQNFVTIKLPSMEKPIWARHEVDPIARNAVIPFKKIAYRRIEITETNKGEPLVDGMILFDAHGEITKFSRVSATGYVTYVVDNPKGGQDVKALDPISDRKPIVFGHIERSESGQYFYIHKASGSSYAFNGFKLGSNGIMLARNKYTFMYFAANLKYIGIDPKIVSLPQKEKFEYELSDNQLSDVSYTRHLLIKRFVDNSRLLGIKTTGEFLYDYSWFNIDTGRITTVFPIYVDKRTGKSVDEYASDLMYLFSTDAGPICISREEEAFKKIYARNLWTGQKELLYTRDHGINSMTAELMANGKIKVVAGMGFNDEVINDVVGHMNKKVKLN